MPPVWHQALLSYSLVVSPILPILIIDSWSKMVKVIIAVKDFMKMKFLRGLLYYNSHGLLSECCIIVVLLLGLTRDIEFTLVVVSVPFMLH